MDGEGGSEESDCGGSDNGGDWALDTALLPGEVEDDIVS